MHSHHYQLSVHVDRLRMSPHTVHACYHPRIKDRPDLIESRKTRWNSDSRAASAIYTEAEKSDAV